MSVNPHSLMAFSELKRQLVSLRLSVYEALLEHGPCTTRELARECGIDLLTVRPRMTDLVQLGFAECIDTQGHEGRYRALTLTEDERAHNERQSKLEHQTEMTLA